MRPAISLSVFPRPCLSLSLRTPLSAPQDPIFGANVLNVHRERIKYVAQLMKATRERAAGNLAMQQALDPLLQLAAQHSRTTTTGGAGSSGNT